MVKGAKTIAQFKILSWAEENFCMPMFKIKLLDASSIRIEDKTGDTMTLSFDEKTNEIINPETKEVLGKYSKAPILER